MPNTSHKQALPRKVLWVDKPQITRNCLATLKISGLVPGQNPVNLAKIFLKFWSWMQIAESPVSKPEVFSGCWRANPHDSWTRWFVSPLSAKHKNSHSLLLCASHGAQHHTTYSPWIHCHLTHPPNRESFTSMVHWKSSVDQDITAPISTRQSLRFVPKCFHANLGSTLVALFCHPDSRVTGR